MYVSSSLHGDDYTQRIVFMPINENAPTNQCVCVCVCVCVVNSTRNIRREHDVIRHAGTYARISRLLAPVVVM